jgi:hypothetical protein
VDIRVIYQDYTKSAWVEITENTDETLVAGVDYTSGVGIKGFEIEETRTMDDFMVRIDYVYGTISI